MHYLIIALAPILIILVYVYIRDKYNKEPLGLLIKSLIAGTMITFPIIYTETYLGLKFYSESPVLAAAWNGFVVAAFTEESFKFIALYLLIWRNRNFDEKFDGIVYAVFISLGFAAVENIMYVYQYGHSTGVSRALTAVPAHAVFGIVMGYYFARSKFEKKESAVNFLKALFVPMFLHGLYDFILMTGYRALLFAFVPFLIYLWRTGFKRMRELKT